VKGAAQDLRIAVFIDWQNAFQSARAAFGPLGESKRFGNFSPYRLALHLAHRRSCDSRGELVRVEIHRGLPSARWDRVGNAANLLQAAAWKSEDLKRVFPRLRPLRYRKGPGSELIASEKGVDVELALAAVGSVISGECDVAIIFSHDSDLLPAVETIRDLKSAGHVETASWTSPTFKTRIPPVRGVFNHFVDRNAFARIEDLTDYSKPARRAGP